MYNRTLNRPMFRRGGRAGGGIMTGVQRQGYAGDDGASSVKQNDPMKQLPSDVDVFRMSLLPYGKQYICLYCDSNGQISSKLHKLALVRFCLQRVVHVLTIPQTHLVFCACSALPPEPHTVNQPKP